MGAKTSSQAGVWTSGRMTPCWMIVLFASTYVSADPGRVPVPDAYIESTMVLELNDELSPVPALPNGKFTIDVRSWTCEGGSIVVFRSPPAGPSEDTKGEVLPAATLAIVWPEGGLFQVMTLEDRQYFFLKVPEPKRVSLQASALHPLALQKWVRLFFEVQGDDLPKGAQDTILENGTRAVSWEQKEGTYETTGAVNEFEVKMTEGLVESLRSSRRTVLGTDILIEFSATPGAYSVANVPSRVEFVNYLDYPESVSSRVIHTITKVERLPPGSTFEAIRARETAGMRVLPPGTSEEVLKWQAKYPKGADTVAGSIRRITTSPLGWGALAIFIVGGGVFFVWWRKLKKSGAAGAPRRPRAH